MGSVVCNMQALVEVRQFSSCGAWAQLHRGMWDLSSLTRECVPCIVRWILYHWTTREVPGLLIFLMSIFVSMFIRGIGL